MASQSWWERFPGRLEHELDLLQAAGLMFEVDQAAKAAGFLRLTVDVPTPKYGIVRVVAGFPDLYPYFRPEVAAPDLDLPHHQHPFGKNLCLIGRDTRFWGTEDTLAWLLTEQLPRALEAGDARTGSEAELVALGEEEQAEPFSDYYASYAPNAMILVSGSWDIPIGCKGGDLTLRLMGQWPPAADRTQPSLAVCSELRDESGGIIAKADPRLTAFPDAPAVAGRWIRVDAPIALNEPKAIWQAAETIDLLRAPPNQSKSGASLQFRAVSFSEEVAWRTAGVGWIFLLHQPGSKRPIQTPRGRKPGRVTLTEKLPESYWLLRAGYAGPDDLNMRIPDLQGLRDCRVIILGGGALGSAVADQLARCGVGSLTVVDSDVFEPGNLVRHAAPFRYLGLMKAAASSRQNVDRSPYVTSCSVEMRIGAVRASSEEQSQSEIIERLLSETDIMVDASAELGVQHFMSDAAVDHRIPYVMASATNGGWGGMVAVLSPERETACWGCLMHHLEDGTIPTPSEAPSKLVQPRGCANPTFTGTGFDLDEVALQAVRVVISTLLVGREGSYRTPTDGVAVLTLCEKGGTPTVPRWEQYPLVRHPSCPNH